MLAAGAQVAGLLLEIERANGRWPLACARSRTDGAAPLIGSSRAIRWVRDPIERVAATDFTVLIEGGSGPQPHPSFIEFFRDAAVNDRDWALEGPAEDRTKRLMWLAASRHSCRCIDGRGAWGTCTPRTSPSVRDEPRLLRWSIPSFSPA
jgi:hypothetical protein